MDESCKLRLADQLPEDRLRITQHAVAGEGLVEHHLGAHSPASPECIDLCLNGLEETLSQVGSATVDGGESGRIQNPDHPFTIKICRASRRA